MQYRPEIDGLRAVAVVPVVLFHAGISGFAGGFVGVDVFFVISGYLITSIIYTEIAEDRFSIVTFYERRVRRILPPMLLVSMVTVPFAYLWMLPEAFKAYANSLIAVNLFSSNILFWREAGYFAAAAELKPLLHSWSLAVEEQFYIIFPLLLLVLRRTRAVVLLVIVALLISVSFVLADWASSRMPSANFYLLPFRAWELGLGAFVAIAMRKHVPERSLVTEFGSALGLVMVAASILLYGAETPFPGRYAIPPVLGTGLIIICAVPGTRVAWCLSWRPVVFVGLLSYSIYLWHQPLFAFARIRLHHDVGLSIYLLLIMVSVGLAYLSWRFVESPFRNKRKMGRKTVFGTAFAGSALLIVVGVVVNTTGGLPARVPQAALALAEVSKERQPGGDEAGCTITPNQGPFTADQYCRFGPSARIVVWGDSHARALVPALRAMAEKRDMGLAQFTAQGCTPVIGYEWAGRPFRCTEKLTAMREAVMADTAPGDLVILHGRWTTLLSPTPFDNGEGGVEAEPVTAPVLSDNPAKAVSADEWPPLLSKTIAPLLEGGRRVALIGPVPEAGWDVPQYMASSLLFGTKIETLSTDLALFERRSSGARAMIEAVAAASDIVVLAPADILCGPVRCNVAEAGQPLYFDDDHLSRLAADRLAEQLAAALTAYGWWR